MLPHASSNASINLRRSKSASSVRFHHKHPLSCESIDPETARLHALIAAHRAMDRSCESTSDIVSRQNSRRGYSATTPRSIRFSTDSSHKRYGGSNLHPETPLSAFRSCQHDLNSFNNILYEPSILNSDSTWTEETYGGQPSSYRKLRKTKSTLYPVRSNDRMPVTVKSRSSLTRGPTLRKAASSMTMKEVGFKLQLKRSFNLLNPNKRRNEGRLPFQPEFGCRPESVALARKQFLQDVSSALPCDGVKNDSSSHSQKLVQSHKSIQVKEGANDHQLVEPCSTKQLCSSDIRRKSISGSFKNRFMRSFGISKRRESFPPRQQVDATRNHFHESITAKNADAGLDSYHDMITKDGGSRHRDSLYIPSDPHPENSEDIEHLTESLPLRCSTNDYGQSLQSRNMSWTNSTLSGSVQSDAFGRKRLSVIKEDGGPHQPSSSVGRHLGGVSIFQQPLVLQEGSQINSQRIYSALLKRINQDETEIQHSSSELPKTHESQGEIDLVPATRPTIRSVPSQSSIASSSAGSYDNPSFESLKSLRRQRTMDSYQNRENVRRRQRVRQMQEQQTDFPTSSIEAESDVSSPFKKLLMDQSFVSDHKSNLLNLEVNSARDNKVAVNVAEHTPIRSNESVYSRTTNGGTNNGYHSPVGSTEHFIPHSNQHFAGTGMATIFDSSYGLHGNPRMRIPTSQSATGSEKRAWRGWVEGQFESLSRRGSKKKGHLREHAEINSDEVEVGCTNASSGPVPAQSQLVLPSSLSHCQPHKSNDSSDVRNQQLPTTNFHLEQLQPRSSSTVLVSKNEENNRGRSKSSTSFDHDHSLQTEGPGTNLTLRNVSVKSFAKFVLGSKKSRSTLSPSLDCDMSNFAKQADSTNSSSKILHSHSRSGSMTNTHELRESSGNLPSRQHIEKTSPTAEVPEIFENSPGDGFKGLLAARLSRPFDMDVPELNRPFDSTYLGRSERKSIEVRKCDRLSVAPTAKNLRVCKSYGGLGLQTKPTVVVNKENLQNPNTTALPPVPERSGINRVASLSNISVNSKRMVSKFLKSRCKNQEKQVGTIEDDGAKSSAFL